MSENYCVSYTPTRLERIGWTLFPYRHCEIPDVRTDEWRDDSTVRDVIVTVTRVEISWLDRLRVLVSGRVEVQAKTATLLMVGATKTEAVFNVRPPAWLDRPLPNKRPLAA